MVDEVFQIQLQFKYRTKQDERFLPNFSFYRKNYKIKCASTMGVSLSLKWEVGDKKLASYFNMGFDSKVSTSEIKQSFKEEACISKEQVIYTFNKMEHLALSCLPLLANLFHLQMFFLVIDSFLLQ